MKARAWIVTVTVAFLTVVALECWAAPVPGRIAISSDGNRHDRDDWFATAVTVAILAKTGNASRLKLYSFNDHIWSTSCCNREEEMRKSAVETARMYGGFDLSRFINAKQNPNAAVDRLVAEINASTSSNPLWIIAAGPMEIVGRALNKSASSRRQYVTVISHSTWNDNHADRPASTESQHRGWTWDEIGRMSSPPRRKHLPDQNSGLYTSHSTYHEWRDSSDAKKRWLWSRNMATGIDWPDCSDAGMAAWLTTGRTDERASPSEIKALVR